MNWAKRQTIETLFTAACEMPVVDCHTHVQDDLSHFDAALGDNSEAERNRAGEMLISELQDGRFTEYAEWLRVMFQLYDGVGDLAPLAPANFDAVQSAIRSQRNDPDFAARVLSAHNISAYVTSIENRDRIPFEPGAQPADIDLAHATHAEAFNMFDANYLVWPEGASG